MDFKRKFIILSSIAGALVLLVLAGAVFSPDNRQSRAARGELVAARAMDRAASVKIEAEGESIELVHEGTLWVYRDGGLSYPVPPDRMKSFFKALGQVNELYKASSKKDTWKDFGLEDGKKTFSLLDGSGAALADVVVGKADPSGKRVYAAKTGDDSVYLVSNVFTSYLRADRPSWSDLRIFPRDLDKKDVQEIVVKADMPGDGQGGTALKVDYHLIRDAKKVWKLSGNGTMDIDPAKADGLINGFIGLDAESFIASDREAAEIRLKEPGATVILRTGKGAELTLRVSRDQVAGKHALRLDGKDYLYNLSGYSAAYYLKSLESLKLEKKENLEKAE